MEGGGLNWIPVGEGAGVAVGDSRAGLPTIKKFRVTTCSIHYFLRAGDLR